MVYYLVSRRQTTIPVNFIYFYGSRVMYYSNFLSYVYTLLRKSFFVKGHIRNCYFSFSVSISVSTRACHSCLISTRESWVRLPDREIRRDQFWYTPLSFQSFQMRAM